MKRSLLALIATLVTGLLLAAPASAQLVFGSIGDLSTQSVTNRSLVGDLARPDSPSGVAPRYVTAQTNPVVTRGETWTNAGPTRACPVALIVPRQWYVRPGLVATAHPILVGPAVTAADQDVCTAGVTVVASCSAAMPSIPYPPPCVAVACVSPAGR